MSLTGREDRCLSTRFAALPAAECGQGHRTASTAWEAWSVHSGQCRRRFLMGRGPGRPQEALLGVLLGDPEGDLVERDLTLTPQ